MALFNKNVVVIKILILVLVFPFLSRTTLGKTDNIQLDPVSILSLELDENQKQTRRMQNKETLYAASDPANQTQKELPATLTPAYALLTPVFNQPDSITPSKPEKSDKKNANDIAEKKLVRENISAITENDTSENKNTLQKLVQEIKSIKITPKSAADTEPQNETEPPQDLADEITDTNTEPETIQQQAEDNKLQFEIIAKIEYLKNHPQAIKQPFMLAELLNENGYYQQAVYFYDMVINDQVKETNIDKTWALMQKANCQKHFEPSQAVETYKQLISQYPDSLWVQPAQANVELLNLYQNQEPEKLINLCRQQPGRENLTGVTQK